MVEFTINNFSWCVVLIVMIFIFSIIISFIAGYDEGYKESYYDMKHDTEILNKSFKHDKIRKF